MVFENDSSVSFTGDEMMRMIFNGFSVVFGTLEGLGITTMDQAGRNIETIETDDPALRWFFDRLATILKDPQPFQVIKGGKD